MEETDLFEMRLNPNLFEISQTQVSLSWANELIVDSSPAEVSGSPLRVSPLCLPCGSPASGLAMVIPAVGKSTHGRSQSPHASQIQA